jgi:hypothetical protein
MSRIPRPPTYATWTSEAPPQGGFAKAVESNNWNTGTSRRDSVSPYSMFWGRTLARKANGQFESPTGSARSWAPAQLYDGSGVPDYGEVDSAGTNNRAYAKAYARFQESVTGETSAAAVNLAERNQALEMISTRSTQMWRAFRALRRGNLAQFSTELGYESTGWANHFRKRNPKDPKDRPYSKSIRGKQTFKNASDIWLEYHFGWSPLIKDIHNSINIFVRDFTAVAKGSGRATDYVSTAYPGGICGVLQAHGWHSYTARRRVQAEVKITNPTLFLAEQLGLTNPLTVAWELIPFSFLVDWVSNVSSVLSAYGGRYGYELLRPRSNRKDSAQSEVGVYIRWCGPPEQPLSVHLPPVYSEGFRFLRSGTLTLPPLVFSLPDVWSWRRALTAISLLGQQIGR